MPDSPEGVALALLNLILQNEPMYLREHLGPGGTVDCVLSLYKQCLAAVIGPELMHLDVEAAPQSAVH